MMENIQQFYQTEMQENTQSERRYVDKNVFTNNFNGVLIHCLRIYTGTLFVNQCFHDVVWSCILMNNSEKN